MASPTQHHAEQPAGARSWSRGSTQEETAGPRVVLLVVLLGVLLVVLTVMTHYRDLSSVLLIGVLNGGSPHRYSGEIGATSRRTSQAKHHASNQQGAQLSAWQDAWKPWRQRLPMLGWYRVHPLQTCRRTLRTRQEGHGAAPQLAPLVGHR